MAINLHQTGACHSVLDDKLVLIGANLDANLNYNAEENAGQLAKEAREEAGNKAADGLLNVVSDHNLRLGMVHEDCNWQKILL